MGFPARLRLGTRLLQMNLVIDVIDPGERNEMMLIARIRVVLSQLYQIAAFQVIYGSHVDAIASNDFHVIFDHYRCDHDFPPYFPADRLTVGIGGGFLQCNRAEQALAKRKPPPPGSAAGVF
jgi:hypothetical protein